MKLQTIAAPLMEMGKPAQVCPDCGHSPIHKTHTYYKGAWKCKPALGVLPGYPKSGTAVGSTPTASTASAPAPTGSTTQSSVNKNSQVGSMVSSATTKASSPKPTPAPTSAPRTITPVAGGPSVTVEPAKTAKPTEIPPVNTDHDISVFLDSHGITDYEINEDKSITVKGDADLTDLGYKKYIPFKLHEVQGEMHLAGHITTLKNCPEVVGGDFDCTHTMIKNLHGMPKKVGENVALTANKELESFDGLDGFICGGDFVADQCAKLTSLKDIHKRIAQIDGTLNFSDTPIKSNVLGILRIRGVKKVILKETKVAEIINKHLEAGDPIVTDVQEELEDAGFSDFAEY